VKFQPNIHVPAAIMDLWEGLRVKFFHHFVRNSYIEKVTEAFTEIPNSYRAAAKMLNLGYFITPGYPTRVNEHPQAHYQLRPSKLF
jgi:hypothetical protein